ncbi:hypothetical protein DACRYDRAFT_24730 [Dacryopinax primogenitus]|uniref:Uncharacterized protein n=1 Tax=Dacryopinax primogenitus (strain DJM 731) TaxID=1858805 RepID=M5FRH4_DACPD|nr:uncharacterized protein DACRYDRAFT_24730 [Dacryopinax primogenitus]EJT98278.1 hypothetical protein DACRYDRAFT_24730 [Dacryopinax primogenitus]
MYRHPGVASVDLVGATLRQGTFIRALYSLGWLTPARFAADPTPLLRAIARFHAWLDLLSLHPAAFLVPTLDIDLAWHTLMLSPGRYRRDVFGLVGRVVEHEDKVEEGVLGEGFDATGRLWKARFGVPYSYCGCPPSTASKLVDRTSLSNIRATLLPLRGRSDSAASARSTASLPGANAPGSASGVPRPTRADLAPDEKDAPLSHASEHNSILVISHSQCAKARQEREMDIAKRGEALRRAAAKGKGDEWEEGIARRSLGHEPAFLLPLPPAGPGVQNDSALFYLPLVLLPLPHACVVRAD